MPLARRLRVVSRAGEAMSDDFQIVREALTDAGPPFPSEEAALAALARIEARLAAAEMLPAYVSGVLCDAATIQVAETDDFAGLHAGLRQLLSERDEAWAAAAEAEPSHALSFAGQERQRATREALHIRDKMREDGERHLLSEVEARDAAIKALREAADGLAEAADDYLASRRIDGAERLRAALAAYEGEVAS